jgi:hypothetical protein
MLNQFYESAQVCLPLKSEGFNPDPLQLLSYPWWISLVFIPDEPLIF